MSARNQKTLAALGVHATTEFLEDVPRAFQELALMAMREMPASKLADRLATLGVEASAPSSASRRSAP